MKRKDTKLYQELAKKYCRARSFVESNQKRLDEHYIELGKAKRKFDSLSTTPIMDEDIKKWYEGYTSTINMVIGLTESNIRSEKDDIERYGKTLVADYEEDLNELYKTVKG